MKKIIPLILLATLLTACGSEQSVKYEDVLYHHFKLINVNGQDISHSDDMQSPYLEFGENFKINGKMCNHFFGQGTYQDGIIHSTGLASTKMLCDDEQLNQLDNMVAQLFEEGAKMTMKNNKLILSSGNNKLTYERNDQIN